MLVGVDINHPGISTSSDSASSSSGNDSHSVAAVVASMDGMAGQVSDCGSVVCLITVF